MSKKCLKIFINFYCRVRGMQPWSFIGSSGDHNVQCKMAKAQLLVATIQTWSNVTLLCCILTFVLIYVQFIFEYDAINFQKQR